MKSPLALAVVAAAVIGLVGYGMTRSGADYRYRLDVAIDTPQGLKVGSSVIAVAFRWQTAIPQSGMRYDVVGDAVPVDLSDGTRIYVLLNSAGYLIRKAYAKKFPMRKTDYENEDPALPEVEQLRAIERCQCPAPIEYDHKNEVANWSYPLIVWLPDSRKLDSMVRLDPTNFSRDLGPGYALRSITVSMTDQNVTYDDRQPQFRSGKGGFIDSDPGPGTRLPSVEQRQLFGYFRERVYR